MNGKKIEYLPANITDLKNCITEYVEFDGWNHFDKKCKSFSELPNNAKKYIKFIEDKLQTPIKIISIGPGREETIKN